MAWRRIARRFARRVRTARGAQRPHDLLELVGELERLRKGALARAQLVHLRLRRSSSRTDGAQYIDESGGVSSLLVIHVELEGGVDAEPRFASVSACDVDVVEAIRWVFVFKSLVQRLFVNFLLSTGS